MAVGLGALVRNTAGGIALFVFLLFVLPGITAILPRATSDAINPYLPLNAGSAVATSTFDPGTHLSPWGGFAVFCRLHGRRRSSPPRLGCCAADA